MAFPSGKPSTPRLLISRIPTARIHPCGRSMLAGLALLTVLLLPGKPLRSQPRLSAYVDATYREYIRSVRFHVNGLALTLPVARLGLSDALFLSFDDLRGDGTRYYYTVVHCDRNWQPTRELRPFEYLQGYQEGEVRDYDMASGTYQHYLHYRLTLPNDEVKWTHSGNYLLVVYEYGEPEDPVLTRRFMVVEELVSAATQVDRPLDVAKQNTHQEVQFHLQVEALRPLDPFNEIRCTVLQNGRWDVSYSEIPPRFVLGNKLDFNYPDRMVFPAGKEFRQLDLSSLRFRSQHVRTIERYPEGYSVTLFEDEPRAQQAYLFRFDLNGKFVPFNVDFIRRRIPADSLASTLNLVQRYNYREQSLGTEYAQVLFSLELPERYPDPVYITGAFADWQLKPENEMRFDDRTGSYTARIYLKQGYYDYGYAIPNAEGRPDLSVLEGDWHATENEYTLLVYYRPRAGEYDRLVGARTFNSYR